MDELDRILLSDKEATPRAGFAASVMRAVRQYASAGPPLRFPWSRFVLGLLAGPACILCVPAIRGTGGEYLARAISWEPVIRQIPPSSVLWGIIMLLASLLAVRLTVEFTSESQ
jgi:hypothetical protein